MDVFGDNVYIPISVVATRGAQLSHAVSQSSRVLAGHGSRSQSFQFTPTVVRLTVTWMTDA